jgi:polysaccharide deacetylase family protein (PEP-CTERM system associated)
MNAQFNLLTVDMEEWFSVEALAGLYSSDNWDSLTSTLERNCNRLLRLFDRKNVQATWFALGWCAERHPALLRGILDAGHEIACHSYSHRRVNSMTPDQFRLDTQRAIDAITGACGVRPIGYRAPSWSINNTVPWALQMLAELGFEYDSSIFPIKHDLYGMPTGPRRPFKMKFDNGKYLYEIPASTQRLLGQNLPLGGGGYLRHSPYWYSRAMIRRLNGQGQAAIVYIHPWEIDPNPPRVEGLSPVQRFRTYGSTDVLEQKLSRLLDDFRFTTMSDHIRLTARNRIGFER